MLARQVSYLRVQGRIRTNIYQVLPLSLRVYLNSCTNMCFIIPQLITAGVLEGLSHRTDQWSYRIPFAIQWVWPAFLFSILLFAHESPWHLVRHGKLEEAEMSLDQTAEEVSKYRREADIGDNRIY